MYRVFRFTVRVYLAYMVAVICQFRKLIMIAPSPLLQSEGMINDL